MEPELQPVDAVSGPNVRNRTSGCEFLLKWLK
jgi:hypothetical protein